MSFALFYLTFIVFYWVLSGFISFYRVLSAFTGCYWVLLSFVSSIIFIVNGLGKQEHLAFYFFSHFFCDFDRSGNEPVFSYRVKKTTTWGTEKEIDFVSIGAPMGRICFAPPAVVFFFFLIIWLRPSARNWRHVAAFSGPLRCDDMEIASPALSRRKKKKAEEKKEEKKRYY